MRKIKETIRGNQLRYKHELGQNFLYDEALTAELVRLSGITPEDDVLEIGPGSGSMTKALCRSAHHVLALELDECLLPLLRVFLAAYPNLEIHQGNVLAEDLPALTVNLRKPFCVVANIPYAITSPLLHLLLNGSLPLRRMALTVQKEVAEKILAQPGDRAYGPLSLRCQYSCAPFLATEIPAACFTPVPKVDSAFVVLPLREMPPVAVPEEKLLFRVISASFALRRKTLVNNLCPVFSLSRTEAESLLIACGLDVRKRGECLSLEDFAALTRALYARMQAKSSVPECISADKT